MPQELSGGEQRRMAIARSLINSPKILLCDEPTGDLDDENTQSVLKLLRNVADKGTAVLMVTHEPEAKKLCGYCYKNGRRSTESRLRFPSFYPRRKTDMVFLRGKMILKKRKKPLEKRNLCYIISIGIFVLFFYCKVSCK